MKITTDGTFSEGQTIIITMPDHASDATNTYQVVNYDLSAFADATLRLDDSTDSADHSGTFVIDSDNAMPEKFTLTFNENDNLPKEAAIAIDIFTFGLDADGDNVNNAIYRIQLEEDGDDSSDFIGTLEYIGLNQMNILDAGTYSGIVAIDDNIILISDDDSISVQYYDLDSTGGYTTFTAEADTPTHSGAVSLDSDGYKVSDVVTVTVADADLNVDSVRADVYTTDGDKIGSTVADLFTVMFDGNDWVAGMLLRRRRRKHHCGRRA